MQRNMQYQVRTSDLNFLFENWLKVEENTNVLCIKKVDPGEQKQLEKEAQ